MSVCDYYYPKARKDHKCLWCGEMILKGEIHTQFKGLWQGDWQNWRMHNECIVPCGKDTDYDEGIEEYVHKRGLIFYKWERVEAQV